MMRPFHFSRNPEIYFGAGKFQLLKSLTTSWQGTPLVVTGGKSFAASSHFETLASLVGPFVHVTINGEPTPEDIDRAVDANRDNNISGVIAIGGGAAMDAGKAIAAMLCEAQGITTYLEGVGTSTPSGHRKPLICVSTTAGTGSEATKNAVITKVGVGGFKKSLRHDNYVPDVAIIDPELHLSCPKSVTAGSGMDAFTQLLESYLSTQANDMTDALALSGLQKIKTALPAVVKDGNHLEARREMAYAALLSGITLANAGLGTVHGFASSVGGAISVPHGTVCGTLMAACNQRTFELIKAQNLEIPFHKYRVAASIFSCATIEQFIDLMHEWTEAFQIARLGEFGLSDDMVDNIVSATGNKNNPSVLEQADMAEVLRSRI